MKIALITTTINVPRVLALYRKFGPDVKFFVAGDKKTPREAYELVLSLAGDSTVCLPESGHQYKCSELIGWNSIQRRNIALLEAVKWGADVIVSVDDDNIPTASTYFFDFATVLRAGAYPEGTVASTQTFNGLASTNHWFDVGRLLDPVASHRGFPHNIDEEPAFDFVTDAKIGVAAGICLGDPDISAVTRIARRPSVHRVSEVLRTGVVTDPRKTWTIFNSQNTAIVRELAPAWFMLPGVGRMDDIYASLIVQRVMRERGLHVHFGQPFVLQQRNLHNLVKDLRGEIDGMENVWKLAGVLDDMPRIAVDKPIVRQIWERISGLDWMPEQTSKAAFAFLDDMDRVA